MAKSMAIVVDGVVTSMMWCSDYAQETDTRKDPGDRPVGIGDTYLDGKWYRDGTEILTPLEQAQKELEELKTENDNLKAKSEDMKQALDILGITDEPIE